MWGSSLLKHRLENVEDNIRNVPGDSQLGGGNPNSMSYGLVGDSAFRLDNRMQRPVPSVAGGKIL